VVILVFWSCCCSNKDKEDNHRKEDKEEEDDNKEEEVGSNAIMLVMGVFWSFARIKKVWVIWSIFFFRSLLFPEAKKPIFCQKKI